MASTEILNNTKVILEKGALDIIVNALKNRTLSGAVYYSTDSNDPTDTNDLWIQIDKYDVGSYNIYLRIYVNETKGWKTIYQGSYNYTRPQIEFLNPNMIDMFKFSNSPLDEVGNPLNASCFLLDISNAIRNIADQCNAFMTSGGLFSEWIGELINAEGETILLTELFGVNEESELTCELVAEAFVSEFDYSYGCITLEMSFAYVFGKEKSACVIFSFFDQSYEDVDVKLLGENIVVDTFVNADMGTLIVTVPIEITERIYNGERAALMVIRN